METFGRRETNSERSQSPEERFRRLAERELERLPRRELDSATREIIEKVLLKLDLKNDLMSSSSQGDIARYHSFKRIGIFIVFDRIAKHEWRDEKSGFVIKKGERYLDLHLPPIHPQKRAELIAETKKSLELLARYIHIHRLSPRYILGITYEKLASVSRHFGFSLIEPNIPEEVLRGVENVYRDFMQQEKKNKKQEIGKILVCYQTLEEFMDRYFKEKK